VAICASCSRRSRYVYPWRGCGSACDTARHNLAREEHGKIIRDVGRGIGNLLGTTAK
jgi:hypothetical protein